jgi:hypothetical protein
MNFLISAEVVNPPTESLPFRDVTSVAKCELLMTVLIEAKEDEKDMYWKFMRPRGMMDYVNYIITPEEKENGFRIDLSEITLINERAIISILRKHIDTSPRLPV